MTKHRDTVINACNKAGLTISDKWLFASIAEQKLYFYDNECSVREYQISTSIKPPSCKENSQGTPNGLHRIHSKIGENEDLGMIFKGRVPIGKRYQDIPKDEQSENLITTRILRLEGLEDGLNQGSDCDSFDRYIYIHGTNREDKIGSPASHGCLLLRNNEVIELFNDCPESSLIYISLD